MHGGSGVSFGVIEALRAARPQAKFLELVHRLDRDTSGLLVVAKKRSALVELHRMLREGEIDKEYLSVVKGHWQGGTRELREALHKYVDAKGERRVAVHENGVAAVTRVRRLKASDEYSFLEVDAPHRAARTRSACTLRTPATRSSATTSTAISSSTTACEGRRAQAVPARKPPFVCPSDHRGNGGAPGAAAGRTSKHFVEKCLK